MGISEHDVVQYVKNLKLTGVKALVGRLEEELGVSAAVLPPIPPPPPPPPRTPTAFDVVLVEVGDSRMDLIRALRREVGLPLRQARDLTESLPAVVRNEVDVPTAASLCAAIEAAGGTVERRPV